MIQENGLQCKVVSPKHYQGKGMQVWDVVNAFAPRTKDPNVVVYWFNVVKYILRFHKKGKRATKVQDLRKCLTYLLKLIEAYEGELHGEKSRGTTGHIQGVPEGDEVQTQLPGTPSSLELYRAVSKAADRTGEGRGQGSLGRVRDGRTDG